MPHQPWFHEAVIIIKQLCNKTTIYHHSERKHLSTGGKDVPNMQKTKINISLFLRAICVQTCNCVSEFLCLQKHSNKRKKSLDIWQNTFCLSKTNSMSVTWCRKTKEWTIHSKNDCLNRDKCMCASVPFSLLSTFACQTTRCNNGNNIRKYLYWQLFGGSHFKPNQYIDFSWFKEIICISWEFFFSSFEIYLD